MQEDIESTNENKTYDFVELWRDQKVLKNECVFKLKNNREKEVQSLPNGEINIL